MQNTQNFSQPPCSERPEHLMPLHSLLGHFAEREILRKPHIHTKTQKYIRKNDENYQPEKVQKIRERPEESSDLASYTQPLKLANDLGVRKKT